MPARLAAPVPGSGAARIPVIDGLRGLALGGILLVNVQSFLWGPGNPLGYFATPPGLLDTAAYALLAILVAGKFYPVFAFLFGVGVALQLRALRRRLGSARAAEQLLRRRLGFLLVVGALHGTLLYFGDVLFTYAACGFVLLAYARARPARLLRALRGWTIAVVVLIGAFIALLALIVAAGPDDFLAERIASREHYLQAGYLAQIPARVTDTLVQLSSSIFVFGPQVVALFLLGMLAGRLGWLRAPQRHPRLWRRARLLGWGIGAPCALAGGILQTLAIRDDPGGIAPLSTLLEAASLLLAAGYVAALVQPGRARIGALLAWAAPAGRMPLSNYLLQSLLLGLLLSGWGLGWGAWLGHAGNCALALAIYVAQVTASRWLLRRVRQGPVEALWRRWTYGATAAGSSSSTRNQTPA